MDRETETARKIHRLIRSKRVLVIHHWDMDGVASAATLAASAGDVAGFYVPPYTFRLDGEVLDEIASRLNRAEMIAVLDYNVPGGSLDLLARRSGLPVAAIDHHFQPEPPRSPFVLYLNPASRGDPGQLWPSAAHVVASVTAVYNPALIALSIAGDLGGAARANRVFQKYMLEAGLHHLHDFGLVEDCVKQVMAADIMGRRDILEDLSARLSDPLEDPCRMLMMDGLLSTLRVRVEEEYRRLAQEEPETLDGILVYRIEGEGRHVSQLARAHAARHPDKIIVVSYYWKPLQRGYIYVRTMRERPRLVDLAAPLRAKGYTAGGKSQPGNNVLGVETRGPPPQQLIEEIIALLREGAAT